MKQSRDGPTVFPVGRETLLWVRQGGQPDRAGRWLRFSAGWQSFWFERNLALQCRLPTPIFLDKDPVFILGLWRSGTTFLHDLLGACPGMTYPATWQCMNASSFRLRVPPIGGNAVMRPMDSFTIDAFSPQEDEFALLALGVPSVYRGFFDPRRLSELACWLKPDAWEVNRPIGWVETWRQFLAGVADGKSGRLVLKSPCHTFRLRALMQAFPDAAYVWPIRDPAEVFFSNRKMWLSMFRHYAMWDWNMADLDMFLQRAFESAAQCLDYAIRTLPLEKLVVVDFAQLTGAPIATMDAINLRMCLSDPEKSKPAIAKAAERKAGYRTDSYDRQMLSPLTTAAFQRLRTVQRAASSSHGISGQGCR